ncbi:hypothetical protein [Lysobacter gummosus]
MPSTACAASCQPSAHSNVPVMAMALASTVYRIKTSWVRGRSSLAR